MAFNELRAIATFAKAAELGSLRRAAVAQGITPQAASQALSQLEAHLNVRLFHRTTRSLSLTEEGSRFLEAAQPGLAALHRALHVVRRDREAIAGPLRITAPRSVMIPVIWPVLDEFCRRHPGIEPDVHLDDRIGNWVDDRIDVGFRAGSPPSEGVISRELLPLQLVVCASPSYLKQHGTPRSIDDLSRHRCSGFRHPGTGKLMPWEFKVGQEVVAVDVASAVNVNDVDLEADAIVAGHCIGQLVGVTAAPLVRSGKLVPVLAAHVTDHLRLHLYYGSRVAQPARVRAFIDLVVEQVAGRAGLFVLADKELSVRRGRAGARN
ncbi:LysR family transcriptional regulator [Piscinibacter terrae]|uniref:LysR family transcriptional regulator n=1 Tax=Piscinibacter terrae TaxID=2496871 RepID=A0A3N7HK65_9BURK|nr:LysR family transcriptional regulator [Albitalea terrae]RQP22464.1 LysR family transcriptional regulator [Albitalea terrae]